MRIGLFFGSFNPPHLGHLKIAEYFFQKKKMDSIWYVLSPQSPWKQSHGLIPAEIRLNMLIQSIQSQKFSKVCTIELSLPIPNYTYNTLIKLQKDHPNNTFELIIGEDHAIDTWYRGTWIKENFTVHVYPRFTKNQNNSIDKNTQNDQEIFRISSTEIREKIKNHKSINHLVTKEVHDIILNQKLYLD